MTLQDLRGASNAINFNTFPDVGTLYMEVEPIGMDRLGAGGSRIISVAVVSPRMDGLLDMIQLPVHETVNYLRRSKHSKPRSVIHCAGIKPSKSVADIFQLFQLRKSPR